MYERTRERQDHRARRPAIIALRCDIVEGASNNSAQVTVFEGRWVTCDGRGHRGRQAVAGGVPGDEMLLLSRRRALP